MHKATMHEAKTHLSALVERAQQGEEVIITSGRTREPVAKVIALSRQKSCTRVPGLFKGTFKIRQDFDKPLDADELTLWMGK